MVVDERERERERSTAPDHGHGPGDRHEHEEGALLWSYLVLLRGHLYAVPDEEGAVLMPHIGRLGHVTALPFGLVPPYVLGLINVGQRGEVLVDLAVYLGLDGVAGPAESRRVVVIGEGAAGEGHGQGGEPYHLAFAVDAGYELTDVTTSSRSARQRTTPVSALVQTARGRAALLDMEGICAAIVRELGAERPWNAVVESHA